jgi:hypothetical protein
VDLDPLVGKENMVTPDLLKYWEKEFREKIKFRPEKNTRLTWLTKRINNHIKKREEVMSSQKEK